jgi:hypothetical protein
VDLPQGAPAIDEQRAEGIGLGERFQRGRTEAALAPQLMQGAIAGAARADQLGRILLPAACDLAEAEAQRQAAVMGAFQRAR